jgi:hypothetical protein
MGGGEEGAKKFMGIMGTLAGGYEATVLNINQLLKDF